MGGARRYDIQCVCTLELTCNSCAPLQRLPLPRACWRHPWSVSGTALCMANRAAYRHCLSVGLVHTASCRAPSPSEAPNCVVRGCQLHCAAPAHPRPAHGPPGRTPASRTPTGSPMRSSTEHRTPINAMSFMSLVRPRYCVCTYVTEVDLHDNLPQQGALLRSEHRPMLLLSTTLGWIALSTSPREGGGPLRRPSLYKTSSPTIPSRAHVMSRGFHASAMIHTKYVPTPPSYALVQLLRILDRELLDDVLRTECRATMREALGAPSFDKLEALLEGVVTVKPDSRASWE